LAEFRNEPAWTRSDPAVTVWELQMSLADGPRVIPVASSIWRLGIATPFLRAVPLVDAPPSEVCVDEKPQIQARAIFGRMTRTQEVVRSTAGQVI
jgi:hypothetical protein